MRWLKNLFKSKEQRDFEKLNNALFFIFTKGLECERDKILAGLEQKKEQAKMVDELLKEKGIKVKKEGKK